MNTIQTQNSTDPIERSRNTILNFGYNLIVFKSKVKKSLAITKRQFSYQLTNSKIGMLF